ncbi:glutathione S-transferase C-terminal domain-containing protein [Streptomyces sp. NBC_00878]|uniref:glutathione S-transferase C-terminal domain-containing protein n=1 Tax=Streptomyces sp. NBC_00878 TaxID=2975854 RepID=UPI00224FC9C4|nr:glutathione S-transferase C-terminal domain-containing protein [Streptomyces sp. NBC_00878]MCX4903517.1 glutathione S-transferase family protein [Streptomyces sp. NBC_00878]
MPETVSRGSSTDTCTAAASRTAASRSAVPGCSPVPGVAVGGTSVPRSVSRPDRFRSRIGVGLAGGFYPAPRRYHLYLCETCPRSRRIAVVLDLLGLRDSLTTTVPKLPAETPQGFASLRGAYEATWHRYDGPLTAPALCDRWSGRVVSNHTPDILRDLAGLLADAGTDGVTDGETDAGTDGETDGGSEGGSEGGTDGGAKPDVSADGARLPALARLDRQLARHSYVLGDEPSIADSDIWVTLTHLDHFDAACTLFPYRHIEAYVRRLALHPELSGDQL